MTPHSASWLQHHQPTCFGMSPVSQSPEEGLRSAVLTSGGAYWASWADSLDMIKQRHPAVANQILRELAQHQEAGFHVAAASTAREELIGIGFLAPAWPQVAAGFRPDVPQVEDHQIGMPGDGWQQAARDVCQTKVECHRAGHVAVSGWASLWCSFQLLSNQHVVRVDASQSVGDRHYNGVRSQAGWIATTAECPRRRSSTGNSQTPEREDLPGAHRSILARQVGGAGV